MRITDGMRYDSLLRDISRAQHRVANAQEQVSSGKKVNKPSDNPVAASDILRINSEKSEGEQFSRNVTFASSKLQFTDGVLDSLEQLVERARTIGQQAFGHPESAGANNDELAGLRDQMMSVSNTTYAGRFVFGGSVTTQPPYVNNGTTISYSGDSDNMSMQIGRAVTVPTQIPGSDLFSGSVNVFDVVANLMTAIQADDHDGIDAGVRALEQFADVVSVTRTKVGGYVNLTSNVQSDLNAAKLANETELSNKEAADIAAAITELTASQNGLQATLAVGANISQLSLLNYLH